MSADDAFSRLMRRNALTIPLATPSGSREEAGTPLPPAASPAVDEAIRVLELLDGAPRDYNPNLAAVEDEGGLFTRPTETDLEAVADRDSLVDMAEAEAHGARIVGRDAADGYGDFPPPRGSALLHGDAGLDQARTVRRLSYIPLRGMDGFENRAREIMAGMQSVDRDRPSLAITSSQRGEGATEIAIRLGLAMARRVGYRILLADFDLRHPQLAARLGLTATYFTLVDVLRGACPLGEALYYSEEDNLYVLPARAADRDGDELMDGGQVQALMGQLHRTFDFSVIGCGPIDHADAAVTCRLAGFAALAGYGGYSRAGPMREAAAELGEMGARVAGVFLTGVQV